MDDDDDKIRRNLVVASALILLVAWLEIPVDQLVDRLIGVKPHDDAKVAMWKLWSAATVVLTYLALRFRFSETTIEAAEEFAKQWVIRRRARVDVFVRDDILRMFSRGERSSVYAGPPIELQPHMQAKPAPLESKSPHLEINVAEDAKSWWKGSFSVTEQQQLHVPFFTTRYAFALPPAPRFMIAVLNAFSLATYSRSTLDIVLPVALALVASGVCIVNLAAAVTK